MSKSWLQALRSKQEQSLPEGFDERFWKKFDSRYGRKKVAWWKSWNLSYTPASLVFALTAWLVFAPLHSSAHHPWMPMNDMATMSEEEWDLVKNLDALDSFENDEDFPQSSDEWQNLLSEANSNHETI